MICYRDMTFCPFYKECGDVCNRALTPEVEKGAELWWKSFKSDDPAPICQFAEKPDCCKESKDVD